jgi:hypothetical protein
VQAYAPTCLAGRAFVGGTLHPHSAHWYTTHSQTRAWQSGTRRPARYRRERCRRLRQATSSRTRFIQLSKWDTCYAFLWVHLPESAVEHFHVAARKEYHGSSRNFQFASSEAEQGQP